jgi:hypothetical protein
MTGRPADRQAAAGRRGYSRLPRGRAAEWPPPLEPPELPPEERARAPTELLPPPLLRGWLPPELPPPPLLRGR